MIMAELLDYCEDAGDCHIEGIGEALRYDTDELSEIAVLDNGKIVLIDESNNVSTYENLIDMRNDGWNETITEISNPAIKIIVQFTDDYNKSKIEYEFNKHYVDIEINWNEKDDCLHFSISNDYREVLDVPFDKIVSYEYFNLTPESYAHDDNIFRGNQIYSSKIIG